MTILYFIVAFFIAITVHEAAHAYAADKLGDPTARLMGRLTLNPIAHIDPYGTLLIPFFLILVGSPFVFGWAKPVPVDPYNLKDPKKDSALISFAGPLVNIALATLAAILFRFGLQNEFLLTLIRFNVILAVFNLIPVHPLDGGKVLVGILPKKEAAAFEFFLSRYGYIVLIMLIFPIFGGTSILSMVVGPVVNLLLNSLAAGHVEGAMVLKNLFLTTSTYAKVALSALLTNPLLYIAETKWGNNETKKFSKAVRRFTKFFQAMSFGAFIGDTAWNVGESVINTDETGPASGKSEQVHTVNNNHGEVKSEVNQSHSHHTDAQGQNPTTVDNEISVLHASSDVEVNTILHNYYEDKLGGVGWVNPENGVKLSDVLAEQTLEYFKDADMFDPHQINYAQFFEDPYHFLTHNQVDMLSRIAETQNVSDYIALIKK